MKIETASHTGFCGNVYILDQYYQMNLKTMEWVEKDDLSEFLIDHYRFFVILDPFQ